MPGTVWNSIGFWGVPERYGRYGISGRVGTVWNGIEIASDWKQYGNSADLQYDSALLYILRTRATCLDVHSNFPDSHYHNWNFELKLNMDRPLAQADGLLLAGKLRLVASGRCGDAIVLRRAEARGLAQ